MSSCQDCRTLRGLESGSEPEKSGSEPLFFNTYNIVSVNNMCTTHFDVVTTGHNTSCCGHCTIDVVTTGHNTSCCGHCTILSILHGFSSGVVVCASAQRAIEVELPCSTWDFLRKFCSEI